MVEWRKKGVVGVRRKLVGSDSSFGKAICDRLFCQFIRTVYDPVLAQKKYPLGVQEQVVQEQVFGGALVRAPQLGR